MEWLQAHKLMQADSEMQKSAPGACGEVLAHVKRKLLDARIGLYKPWWLLRSTHACLCSMGDAGPAQLLQDGCPQSPEGPDPAR